MKTKTQKLVFSALIAGIYAALTIFTMAISFQQAQIRIAEALTILPFFSAYAISGLTIGCLISNIFSPFGLADMIFGTLATFISAVITHLIGKSNLKYKKYIAPLPAVLVNAVIVAFEINCVMVKNPISISNFIKNSMNHQASLSSIFNLSFNLRINPVVFIVSMLWVALGELIACYVLGLPLLIAIDKNKKLKNYLE